MRRWRRTGGWGRRGGRGWSGRRSSNGGVGVVPGPVRQRRRHERNAAGDVRRGLLPREHARAEKVSEATVCAGAFGLDFLSPGLTLSPGRRRHV